MQGQAGLSGASGCNVPRTDVRMPSESVPTVEGKSHDQASSVLPTPWRASPWLDPLEDFQVLPNAPEVAHATTKIEGRSDPLTVQARASIAFTDGTDAIETVGVGPSENEARRYAAQNALIVLRTRAPYLAQSLDNRQAKNAKTRRQRARRKERRAAAAAA